jgi:hypothetical protein
MNIFLNFQDGFFTVYISLKVEPLTTRYQINLRSGATGTKIFTSIERFKDRSF